jgi:hypothetical protein
MRDSPGTVGEAGQVLNRWFVRDLATVPDGE